MAKFERMRRVMPIVKHLYMVLASMTSIILLTAFALDGAIHAVAIEDNGNVTTVNTLATDPDDILQEAGITLANQDSYSYTGLKDGTGSITLMRAFLVTVTDNGKCYKVQTTGGDVADALKQAGIQLDANDMVNLALDTCLTENMAIAVTRVGYETETKQIEIPFDTKTVYSDSLPAGEEKVTAGQTGIKTLTYSYKLYNGRIVSTEVVEETITRDVVNAVRTVGTKTQTKTVTAQHYSSIQNKCVSELTPDTDFELDENGVPLHYSKKISGKGSAYYWTGNRTATGIWPKPGYIAVNPNVIPYHTKLFIRTPDGSYFYGYAVAEDTGGFTKSTNRIVDLYFNTYNECMQFGVRTVDVYVLD